MKTIEGLGVIVSAGVCCGKTYLGQHYKTVLDLESTPYNYILTEEQKLLDNEQLKGTKKELNPNFLDDYYLAIKDAVLKYDVVLVAPGKKIRAMLQEKKLDYIVAYPDENCLEEYIGRAKNRGNNESFVERMKNGMIPEGMTTDIYATKHIVLHSGEYLENALLKEHLISKQDKVLNR